MSDRLKFSERHAENEGPLPASEMMATLGQIYVVILFALIIGVANVNVTGLVDAIGVLQFGDPATSANFTA
jgi:hypothetical protein